MTQAVYIDETGFSGPNLTDPDQPFVAYAAVAIDQAEAARAVSELRKEFGGQASELKGRQLLRTASGIRLIERVMDGCLDKARFVIHNKRYALSCKFFEYVFEPVLAPVSALFYSRGFHAFIADYIHLESCTRNLAVENMLAGFQAWMRDPGGTLTLLGSGADGTSSPVICSIQEFAQCQRAAIVAEHEGIHEDPESSRWTLDLTSTSIFGLLTALSEKYEGLIVYCDDSKPARAFADKFAHGAGRTLEMAGRRLNLAEPIHFVTSTSCPGVQLADVLVAACVHAFTKEEPWCQGWRDRFQSRFIGSNILPEPQRLDPFAKRDFTALLVLDELVRRCRMGEGMLDAWPEFLENVEAMHAAFVHAQRQQEKNE